ncbi:MAG: dNTP triphosphohydrolase, partial [Desulfamplus sp.]|nr:dNTP triphosphohydrolase [Desulfamplus sp.]
MNITSHYISKDQSICQNSFACKSAPATCQPVDTSKDNTKSEIKVSSDDALTHSDQSICQRYQKREKKLLSKYGCPSTVAGPRLREESECSIRTPFQLDRDRIVYSNAFRRLKHKTQVFLSPLGDHYRTRLTHTLEVSEIARNITRAMRLNEDLAEAIALGHDLGHTPFGHGGETALKEIYSRHFSHNAQSLRVVDKLEKRGDGLN